jgi:predicted phosphoribosyltransferase
VDLYDLQFFRDRTHAGRELADRLDAYRGRDDVIVLALPRGGVPVGFEIARRLRVPLDVFVVRKLGVPGQEELAMGAIAAGGGRVINDNVVHMLGLTQLDVERAVAREEPELHRRTLLYRGERRYPNLHGHTILLVDDGIATGATLHAAIGALHNLGAVHIVVAVPVAPPDAVNALRRQVDAVVALQTPDPFWAIGIHYQRFEQITDETVRAMLDDAALFGVEQPPSPSPAP